jgi:uncharacterized SAM-binding protein YcdF (DUF218 family)
VFFFLSKVLGFFSEPSNLLLTIGAAGVALWATRFATVGRWMAGSALLLLAFLGLSPFGNAIILPLEQRFPRWDGAPPDGVVVLGGAVDELIAAARGETSLNEAAERMTAAVELARRYPDARIVFTGGNARPFISQRTEAEFAQVLFERLGVAPGRILLDDRSRNTIENAEFTRMIVAPKPNERWLLVTSAYHMPRAVGVFRKAEFPVEAYPVDWRTRGSQDLWRPFDRASDGLRRTDVAVREWTGLLIYWLTGRSSALFPAP